jgi:AcrR family transcriptional regulator
MDNPRAETSQGRGRPRKDVQRHVIQDLMQAAESALANKTAKELTIHEVALAAGVNDAMIHYYFGGKDGLLVAIFHEIMSGAPYKHADSIRDECVAQKSIKPLIEALVKFYYARPSLIRMSMVELFSTSSKINDVYKAKYFDVTPNFVEFVVKSMMDLGIYKRTFDVKFLNSSIFSIIMGPIIVLRSTDILTMSDKDGPAWIDDIARLIDVALKSPESHGA